MRELDLERRPRRRGRRLGAGRGRRRLGRPRDAGRHDRGPVREPEAGRRSTRSTPDAMLATVSAIGAPAAKGWQMFPGDYVRALQLLMDAVDEPIVGTVTAQNGSSTTCNGWVASAVLGTPRDRRRRRWPRPPDRQNGLVRPRRRRRLRDRAGGRGRQPRREPVPRGRHPRDRAPHRQRAAHRLRHVGRVHLLRAQPAAGVVRRRARRRRRDQLRAVAGRVDPRRRGRRARGDDPGDRRPSRRTDPRARAGARRRRCGPRTRSTSARSPSASSSSGSSTST